MVKPATILIADDYDDNRELLRLVLANAHYKVLEASNGKDCLKIARDSHPDLIMIDLSMPVVDGWSVFHELRAHQETAEIPCIALTAHAETQRVKALECGFNAYISKPFRTAELLATIKQVLQQHIQSLGAKGKQSG